MYWKWHIKKNSKKKVGLAKLSYLQDPMSDRNFCLSATLMAAMFVNGSGRNEQWGPSIDASYQVSVHLAEGF